MNIISFPPSQRPPDPQLLGQARDWLILLTSGQATEIDAQAFRQWCELSPEHAQAFEQTKALWHVLKPAAQVLQQQARGRQLGRRAFLGGAVAASAAFFLVRFTVPGGFSGIGADYSTAVGEQRRVQLADGVSLELNTRTRVSRLSLGGAGQGVDLLSGEVEVLSQRPLKVHAQGGWLSAAQARFNVRNTDNSVCVTCVEGVVQVDALGQTVPLNRGQQLIYNALHVGEPQPVDTSLVTAWRQQVLVFNDATLASVIDEINRYRPGMLLLLNAELGKRKVQARFSLNQLPGVALLIRDAYGAKCTELPGGVVLLS